MITGHILHNEHGGVVAIIDNRISGNILTEASGAWTTIKLKDGRAVQAFVFSESSVLRVRGLQLYIEPGYKLRRNDTISVNFD